MRMTAILAVLALAGAAVADELADPTYDPHAEKPAAPAPVTGLRIQSGSDRISAAGQSAPIDKAALVRKPVITVEGDEIGVIRDVRYSEVHGEAVAVIDIDAFIGIGEKRIAIPLSQIDWSDSSADSVATTLTRSAVESAEAVDETDLSAIE